MPNDIVLSRDLAKDFIKKGTKAKKGGLGEGGIYRKKSDLRDYMVKITSGYHNTGQDNRFRSHQEVLASRLAIACGVAVPKMYEVINSNPHHPPNAEIYVASEIIQNSKDFSAKEINKQLQDPKKRNQNIDFLSNCVVHAWLCNRDLVNKVGANFVKDQDGRIYNVDLGNCLLSGFRGPSGHITPDLINFMDEDPVKLIPFLDTTSPDKFTLKAAYGITDIEIKNKDQLSKLTIEDPELQKSCFLQGLLKIMAISQEELSAIVASSGDTPENQQAIIDGLQIRKQKLITYAAHAYGFHALEEEALALNIQKIMHQACVFPECPITTGDARVSWYAQMQNASKPKVIVYYDYQNPSLRTYTYTCTYENATQAQQALKVFKKLDFNNITLEDNVITITTENREEIYEKLYKNIIADKLQILLGSYGIKQTATYKTPYQYDSHTFKGINRDGLRPIVTIGNHPLIIEFDKQQISAEAFKELLSNTYDLTPTDFETLTPDTGDKIIITDPNKFMRLVTTNIGARKTAIVSENEQGQVLAGQLDPTKKGGKKGFATAGGNSDLPMNPQKAAAQEAGDEFGYTIREHTALQPIGSTLTTNVSNIFLAPPNITSTSPTPIGYKEFQDGTIKWYSFNEFRQEYNKTKDSPKYNDKIKFDRSSIEYYVKHYQREIQQQLQALGLDNFIVICSKKPDTLGQIYIKPSIPTNDADSSTLITLEQEQLLNNILRERGISFTTEDKTSLIKKATTDGKPAEYINRKIIKIDEHLNPGVFLQKLINPQTSTWQNPQPTVTTNQDLIKNVDWSRELQHSDFKFLQLANKPSDPHYLGSITNNKNPPDPLINITTNSLKCPLNNQQLKPKQPEAMVTALQLIIQKNNKNFKNPLTIKANHFTAEHLSEIMIILKNRNIPVFFQSDKNNPEDIKQLINNYNKDQFHQKHEDSHKDYDWVDAGGEGNCLFLSIAHQLNARNIAITDHQQVRENIADYINDNWDIFKEFIDGESTYKAGLGNIGGHALTKQEKAQYIAYLKQDGSWGDNVSMKAAAELFNINIIVKSQQDKQHDHFEQAADPNTSNGTIYIGHISEFHYQSLFLKDQTTLATTSSTKPLTGFRN